MGMLKCLKLLFRDGSNASAREELIRRVEREEAAIRMAENSDGSDRLKPASIFEYTEKSLQNNPFHALKPIRVVEIKDWLEKYRADLSIIDKKCWEDWRKSRKQNKPTARKNDCQNDKNCQCPNCSTIVELSECGVCLEPLQTRRVRSCPTCGNIICSDCAERVDKCAFCRVTEPLLENPTVERLLRKLSLPCRNARLGCTKMLKSEIRVKHEANCNYSGARCPLLEKACNWEGKPSEILDHLRRHHSIKPFAGFGLRVEIANFRIHPFAQCGKSTIYLRGLKQLCVVHMETYDTVIGFQASRLCFTDDVSEEEANIHYALFFTLSRYDGQGMTGMLPFGKFTGEVRPMVITTGFYFHPDHHPEAMDDKLRISLSLGQIDKKDYYYDDDY